MKIDKLNKGKAVKILIILAILIVVAVFLKNAAGFARDYSERTKKYEEAVSFYKAGKTDEAIELFGELGEYKDSKNYAKSSIGNLQKGDTFYFGRYEQDEKSEGKELIEWIVLERKEDKALLLSKYCIEQRVFDGSGKKTNWEKSDMRKWLNGPFAETAFTKEQADVYLAEVSLANDENSKYGGEKQENTTDKVFLLSEKEFQTYVEEEDKVAYATPRLNKIAYTNEGKIMYWLRTTGGNELNAINVSFEGTVNELGYIANHSISEKHPDLENQSIGYGSFGVRPAMWINLN